MATWPDAVTYREFARVPADGKDDSAIEAALAAVRAAVVARCPQLADVTDPDVPDDVAVAVLLWTNRLVNRRNSPEGVVGASEFGGMANIRSYDPDVGRLLAPYVAPVIA